MAKTIVDTRVLFLGGNNIDDTIMVGEANEDKLYFVKRAINDNIYLISKEQRDKLDKKISDLTK